MDAFIGMKTVVKVGEPEKWYWHWGHCDGLGPERKCSLCTGEMVATITAVKFGHQVVVDGDTPIKVERPTPTITKEDLEEMYRIGMSHPPSTLILCPRF